MSSSGYGQYGYYPTHSQPIAMPTKENMPVYGYNHYDYSQISSSPVEETDLSSVGGATYDPSATDASYAASMSDYEAPQSGISSVDLLEFMNERLQSSYDPISMDRNLVQQVQTSAELNAKQRQLMEMQAKMQAKMAAMQSSMVPNIKKAKQIQRDLDWTQKKVNSLNKKAARKYAEEYAMATERYPSSP